MFDHLKDLDQELVYACIIYAIIFTYYWTIKKFDIDDAVDIAFANISKTTQASITKEAYACKKPKCETLDAVPFDIGSLIMVTANIAFKTFIMTLYIQFGLYLIDLLLFSVLQFGEEYVDDDMISALYTVPTAISYQMFNVVLSVCICLVFVYIYSHFAIKRIDVIDQQKVHLHVDMLMLAIYVIFLSCLFHFVFI
jgi:hypothetical protein